jgi:hypothetical protein
MRLQWSVRGGSPGNGVPIVIRAAQWTPFTDVERTAKSVPIVSHLPNEYCALGGCWAGLSQQLASGFCECKLDTAVAVSTFNDAASDMMNMNVVTIQAIL